jgi:BirA family biotin operon repressor/biotin-[acetyl-CoA-carboxylase] ligase
MMNIKTIRFKETDSTSRYLREYVPAEGEDMTIAVADFQTAGQGMGTNTWESEPGQNLLFSILVHPVMLPVNRQFLLSMAEAVALQETLSRYTDGITIKWPNDIYWHDQKISGTRIDTSLSSHGIKNFILGTGIDVNQREFHSDAPNPVSLRQILGHDVDRDELLNRVTDSFMKYYGMIVGGDYTDIAALYHQSLYRAHGFHSYSDADGDFEAAIVEVEDDGHLILRDREGMIRSYEFKEIKFKI